MAEFIPPQQASMLKLSIAARAAFTDQPMLENVQAIFPFEVA